MNHGVDLYRSDTGHYLEWPVAPGNTVTSPAGVARQPHWTVAGVDAAPAAEIASTRVRVWASTEPAVDRRTLAVALVNWMVLLVLLCGFLLAKTLPSAESALGETGVPAAPSTTTVAAAAR